MSTPLWADAEPCGCSLGAGHTCPPPWVDDWPGLCTDLGTDNRFRPNRQVESGAQINGAPSLREQTRGDDHASEGTVIA